MECLEDTIKKTKNTKRGNRMYNFKKIEKKWQEYWDKETLLIYSKAFYHYL